MALLISVSRRATLRSKSMISAKIVTSSAVTISSLIAGHATTNARTSRFVVFMPIEL